MPLMQDLLVGVSGLNMAQRSINVSAHNLSNVENDGFVRQQVIQDSSLYNLIGYGKVNYLQVGIGVDTGAIYQVRDTFLDQAFRLESGRGAFYSAQYEAVSEIEELFGELQGVAFQDSLEDLWYAMQEMAKDPGSLTTRSTLVETAVGFVDRADNIYTLLRKYQTDLDSEVLKIVNRINEIGSRMVELNTEICEYESNGMDRANDLRDERNKLLDELGTMVKISYRENSESRVSISIEEVPFVTEDTYFKMDTVRSEELEQIQRRAAGLSVDENVTNTGLSVLVPVWPAYGYEEVCDLSRVPCSAQNTDVGELRGLLVARGKKVGNYTDIPSSPRKEDFIADDGSFDEAAYTKAETQFESDYLKYLTDVDASLITTVQARFDRLINGIVTTVNDILCPNKTVTLDDGSKVKILDLDNAPVGMDDDATVGEALFNRKSYSRYTRKEITLADGTTINAYVYNEEDPSDNYSLFTLGEIEVNPVIKENLSKLPLSKKGGTGDNSIDTCDKLIKAWQNPFSELTPDSLAMDTFYEYYNEFIGAIATRGSELKAISDNQKVMTEKLDDQRNSITGVSSDEELTNLIKFQHAYNASARYVNVVNEMLATILERM